MKRDSRGRFKGKRLRRFTFEPSHVESGDRDDGAFKLVFYDIDKTVTLVLSDYFLRCLPEELWKILKSRRELLNEADSAMKGHDQ